MGLVRPTLAQVLKYGRGPYAGPALPWEGPTGGAPYDPSQESGIILDMWAESGVTQAGTGVSSWVSGTGGHNFIQTTDGNRPTYEAAGLGGRPSVLFVAANSDALSDATGPSASANNWTVIAAVGVVSLPGTFRYLLDFQTGRMIVVLSENPATDIGHFDSSAFRSAPGMTTGNAIYTWHLHTSGAEYFKGSTSLGTAAYGATALGGACGLGTNNTANNNWIDARIGRVMMFSGVDTNRTGRVRNWMSSHYGIAL